MINKTKLRKYTLTDERALAIGQSYRLMYVLASMMDLEFTKYRDTNFKDPLLHKEISKMGETIAKVLKHHKVAVGDTENLNVLGYVDDLLDINKLMINNVDHKRVGVFARRFTKMVTVKEVAA